MFLSHLDFFKFSHLDLRSSFSVYYYSIIQQATGKALDATSEGDIIIYPYHGGENQLWSWEDNIDKTTLVNRKFNNRLVFSPQGV